MAAVELSAITYNIHKGFSGEGRRRFVLSRMREALAGSGADVVFLQEAQGEHRLHAQRMEEWPGTAQFEFLADSIWPHHAYGKNAVYDHGHHGNAILSRYPLLQWENIAVSPYPFAASRSLLHASIQVPGRDVIVHLLCIHFGFIGLERRGQIRRMCDRIEQHIPHDDPLIVAGDFNDWTGRAERDFNAGLELTEVYRSMTGRHARTWPAWAPLLPMDRIYARGIEAMRAERLDGPPWEDLSDHAPLQAWFRL
ncbi:MAG: EEP domain-containing protein [Gammaproteobacteria bacterium]|nr:EEP domain-containing protein [Gammaproteobacteria bacterium]